MEKVEYYFREISKIPRGSYNEKAICDYVENFAKERNIKYVRDKMHNIVLFKEATEGYEDHETVMLEGHMDMVCEKNNDSDHDFSKDSIELIEEDGFLHANKTTLGADDGVGVCYMLALLDDESLKHPALECVFTVQEEVGLRGLQVLAAHTRWEPVEERLDGRVLQLAGGFTHDGRTGLADAVGVGCLHGSTTHDLE